LIHPGSSPRAGHKRYAPSAWGEVAQRLAKNGIQVWVASGSSRDERNLVEEIIRTSEGASVPAPETRSFDDLLALLIRASVFVSCDSGPLHAASLVGVPVVQLLGPTHPIHNEPWPHSPSRRVHIPLACSPCRRGCAEATCMRAIPPSLVADEIRGLREDCIRPGAPISEHPE
jgi:ADP-heptose:LPS heptosyltransferase